MWLKHPLLQTGPWLNLHQKESSKLRRAIKVVPSAYISNTMDKLGCSTLNNILHSSVVCNVKC